MRFGRCCVRLAVTGVGIRSLGVAKRNGLATAHLRPDVTPDARQVDEAEYYRSPCVYVKSVSHIFEPLPLPGVEPPTQI